MSVRKKIEKIFHVLKLALLNQETYNQLEKKITHFFFELNNYIYKPNNR